MGYFDDILADTNHVFLDAFAERQMVVYRPYKGLPRPVRAIIDRPLPEVLQAGHPPQVHGLLVSVANDARTGIAAAEFNADGDMINLPVNLYGVVPGVPWHFEGGIVSQDGGMITVKAIP